MRIKSQRCVYDNSAEGKKERIKFSFHDSSGAIETRENRDFFALPLTPTKAVRIQFAYGIFCLFYQLRNVLPNDARSPGNSPTIPGSFAYIFVSGTIRKHAFIYCEDERCNGMFERKLRKLSRDITERSVGIGWWYYCRWRWFQVLFCVYTVLFFADVECAVRFKVLIQNKCSIYLTFLNWIR